MRGCVQIAVRVREPGTHKLICASRACDYEQVQVNISAGNNDDAVKLLISDYEKKIRDIEEARQGDKQMIKYLQHQLEAQKKQFSAANDKIRALAKQMIYGPRDSSSGIQDSQKQLPPTRNGTAQPTLLQLFKQSAHYLAPAGCLFTTHHNITSKDLKRDLKPEW